MSEDIPKHIWKQMTEKEQIDYTCMTLIGFSGFDEDGTAVVMRGKWAFDKIQEERNRLLMKYEQPPNNH